MRAGDALGDRAQGSIGLAVIGKTAFGCSDDIGPALPGAHQPRAGAQRGAGLRSDTAGLGEGLAQVINDNYSCRLPRTRSAGLWTHRESCETARFPCGGRVDHGCPGAAIARETDVGEDVGGGRGGGRDERADGATLAERRVAVDGEGASDVADAGGPVRRRVGVGGRAAVGGGYGGTTAGADAVRPDDGGRGAGAAPNAGGPPRVRCLFTASYPTFGYATQRWHTYRHTRDNPGYCLSY